MPIRTRIEIKGRFDLVPEIARQEGEARFKTAAQEAFTAIKPELEAALKQTPRPSVHPFVWSNDPAANARARRWYFWAIREGIIPTDGRRYKRSGKLGTIWDIELLDNPPQILVKTNETDERGRFRYRWVVGTFDRRTGTRWQIPGHRRTGWYLVQNVTDRYFIEFVDDIERRFERVIVVPSIRNR